MRSGTARTTGVERGETLVEILVTVAIMGIAFVGIFEGLTGSFTMSAAHRDSADGVNLLVSAADAVKAASYVPCPTLSTSSYTPTQGVSLPAGWSTANVAITAVEGWNGSSFGACPATDGSLELITVTVTAPAGDWSQSVDVVKRNPA